MNALPDGLLLSYYGDDFTGSSAVMEVMHFAGLPSVMFLRPPDAARLSKFDQMRCIGIAGIARSRSPEWMDDHLPDTYAALAHLSAPLTHYKVCSTFDSAPHTGSIGRAIDLGVAQFKPQSGVPMVVGAPAMGRYQAFGSLFATVDGTTHRLDRHPVMTHHPVTPMNEADLLRHLAAQTRRRMALIDFPTLHQGLGQPRYEALSGPDAPVISIDVLDDKSLVAAGDLLWNNRESAPFVAGSQGVEYALIAAWRASGMIPPEYRTQKAQSLPQIMAVSGSCSPVTAAQIGHAERNGFTGIRLNTHLIIDENSWQGECHRAADDAMRALDSGQSPLVFTASGPDDPAIAEFSHACAASGLNSAVLNERLGTGLGQILALVMDRAPLPRLLIAGGDTSGHATLTLGIDALSPIAQLVPGAPLCRAYSDLVARDGVELCLKGGQMGAQDFFSVVRHGGPLP